MFIKLIEEEASPMKLQGIVTILRSDHCQGSTKSAASIRRTLSADMSSKKWLSQNGFFNSTIKKNVSSEVLINIPNQDDVWKSIQSEKAKNDEMMMKKPAVWGEILSTNEKNKDSENCPNYVHPLLKRSARSLSHKSLEICTESLGSETGSDVYSNSGFSSDADEDHDQEVRVVVNEEYNEFKEMNDRLDDLHVVKYKKSPVRPFPPPLPSIGGGDGAAPSLHMNSRRENGRLVLEAVSVPARNNFHARRHNGRLVLSLIHKESKVEEFEKVFDIEEEKMDGGGDDHGYEKEEEEEEEEKVVTTAAEKFVVEENLRSLPSGIVMKKLMAFGNNKNSTWSNKAVNVMAAAAKAEAAAEAEEKLPYPHSLPPPPHGARLIPSPPPPTVASFNVYEYFWRNKTTASGGGFITTQHLKNNSGGGGGSRARQNQDYFVGCKETRRSLLIWEPYCIATS